jgi:hypothetical protein
MDNQYPDYVEGHVYPEFQPEWNWRLPEREVGEAALRAAHDVSMLAADLVYTGLIWCAKYVGAHNPIHDFYTGSHNSRPAELYDEDELHDFPPVPLPVLGGDCPISTANVADIHKSTTFQLHWAAMVRAEFCGYWGTRAEQLCAARWLRLQLEAINVRKAHIASAIPIILVLALAPTQDEDAAHKLSSSEEFMALSGRLSWPRRLWRWVRGRKHIAARRTNFTAGK